MNQYPDAVAAIANDYLERVKAHLRLLPASEQEDFLREIQSHLHEAYDRTPGSDDVARILGVLRSFGEPAEVVSDRLPQAMVRSGTGRKLPLYIAGGWLVALFGLPLGAGGFGVLVGLLAALAGLLVAYYAVAGSLLLTGAITLVLGLTRLIAPEVWDKLVRIGVIHLDGPAQFPERLSASDEALIVMALGAMLLAGGWGLLKLGTNMIRGLRFLFNLVFDWMRRFAQEIRRRLRGAEPEKPALLVAKRA
jgi:uncharacterized membrane protein